MTRATSATHDGQDSGGGKPQPSKSIHQLAGGALRPPRRAAPPPSGSASPAGLFFRIVDVSHSRWSLPAGDAAVGAGARCVKGLVPASTKSRGEIIPLGHAAVICGAAITITLLISDGLFSQSQGVNGWARPSIVFAACVAAVATLGLTAIRAFPKASFSTIKPAKVSTAIHSPSFSSALSKVWSGMRVAMLIGTLRLLRPHYGAGVVGNEREPRVDSRGIFVPQKFQFGAGCHERHCF